MPTTRVVTQRPIALPISAFARRGAERHERQHPLEQGGEVVADRPGIATVVELEELRAEVGHVDAHGALRRARLAGQTARHGVVDLVREVSGALGMEASAARAARSMASPRGPAAACVATTPFSASRRSHSRISVARPLGEWMRSRVIFDDGHITLSVLVSKHCPLPLQWMTVLSASRSAGAICRSSAPRVGPSTRASRWRPPAGRRDLSRVELVARVEDGLDALELGVEDGTEVVRHELGAEALAVLAPEQPAVARHERGDRRR